MPESYMLPPGELEERLMTCPAVAKAQTYGKVQMVVTTGQKSQLIKAYLKVRWVLWELPFLQLILKSYLLSLKPMMEAFIALIMVEIPGLEPMKRGI